MICEYSGLNFHEIIQLNILDYLQLRRDAFITHLNKTEEGQKYLKDAWRLAQTDMDSNTLSKLFGQAKQP